VSIDAIMDGIASDTTRERFSPRLHDPEKQEEQYRAALLVREKLQHMLRSYYGKYRVQAMVYPTTPFPAVSLDGENPDLEINGELVPNGFGHLIDFSVHQSVAGFPSITVPAGLTVDGLPVGISFDALPGSEELLFGLGLGWEMLRGPFPLPPVTEPDRI